MAGEASQQTFLGDDFSILSAFLVILTLVGLDILLPLLKPKPSRFAKWIDGVLMAFRSSLLRTAGL